MYNITQINSTQALVTLDVAGYIPPTATAAVRIDDSSSLTPILAYNTACGPLLNPQSSSLDPSGLARFINISGAIHFFLILVYSLGDFGWGGMVRRSLMLDFLLHMRFVNVDMTSDLQQFYSIASKSYIAAGLPVSIGNGDSTATGKFGQFAFPPQFFANFCGEFFALLIALVTGLLVALLAAIRWKKMEGFPKFIRYLDRSINYNLSVNLLLGYSLRAFVGLMANFANLSFGSPLNTLSFLLAILFLIIYLILAGLIIRALRQRTTAVKRSERIFYGRATILYQDYAFDSLFQQSFIPLLLLRVFLTAIILVAFQNSPTTQLILLVLVQLVYCTYTYGALPIKQSMDHIVDAVGELLLAFVTIAMFGLGSLTAYGSSESSNTIAWGCIIFTFFYALFLLFILISEVTANITTLFRCIPNPEEFKAKPAKTKEESAPVKEEPVKQLSLTEEKQEIEPITYEVREIKLKLQPYFTGPKRRKIPEIESEPDEPEESPEPEAFNEPEEPSAKEFTLEVMNYSQPTIRGDTSRRSNSELLSEAEKERLRREQQLREQRQLNQARLILKDIFEEELQNNAIDDEDLIEVQEVKAARERLRQKALEDISSEKSRNGRSQLDTTSVRIMPILENRPDLTQKQVEESVKLTDKVLKMAASQLIRQQQQQSRREQQAQNGYRSLLRTSSLSMLNESMKIDRSDRERQTGLMNNSADASFIENFLREIPSDNPIQKPRDRRMSAQSDVLGAELESETNRMRGIPSKRTKILSNADVLDYIMKKHGNKVEPKINEEFEFETPKHGANHQGKNSQKEFSGAKIFQ